MHEGGYTCEKTASGEIVFTAPDQQRLPDHAPLPAVDEDLYGWLEREMQDHDIGPDTCLPHWRAGENIDWHMAVSALFPYPHR